MRPLILSILAAATVAAIPAAATAREKPTPEAKLAKLLEGRVAGDPQDCLPLSSLGSSQVIDGTAIVYRSGATHAVPETVESSLQLSESVLVDLGVAVGPVIASIHQKRDELRGLIMEEGALDHKPQLRTRTLRPEG